MILKADKNKVTLSNWLLLSGEIKARTIKVELSDELLQCTTCLLKVTLQDGTVIDAPIKEGKVEFPCIEEPQQIVIGVTSYNTDENGNLEIRYSPEPCFYYVPLGSFKKVGKEQGALSPGSYEEVFQELMKKTPFPRIENEISHGTVGQILRSYGDGRTYWDDKKMSPFDKLPFEAIDLPLTETNYAYVFKNGECQKKDAAEGGFSPVTKCPKYLGFRIDDSETRLYLYIGTLNDKGEFEFDDTYHIDTTNTGEVNHLRQSHNRFIQTDGDKELYFYYKINAGSKEKVTLVGCDEFPQSESDIIATDNVIVKNNGDLRTETQKYYSIVLPSGCFYAVFNKKGMPTFLKDDIEDDELTTKPIFNVSYQTGVKVVDGEKVPVIEISRGASFGFIPENVGAALLRLPHTYNLSDLCIYTDKIVKSNAKSGRRAKAKEIGEKLIKDFSFEARKEIFWNDNPRSMKLGRRFYGVPYSSRWVNSHYVGFEVSAETALNALNDPYSVAYDGGFIAVADNKKVRDESVSDHTEITGDPNDLKDGGGTGYGLVCSAFTSLITGNPYPQTNRGYTFDSNFVLEDTFDMNNGEVLVNKGLSHCVFVDEIYDNGYSLYEAVDPCVAKTTHTCPENKATYAASKVRTSYLDNYSYSVVNKDTSGYEKLATLLNFENITIANGSVRPWRGNKAVYGSWDVIGSSKDGFKGSGIGVTIHNKDDNGNPIATEFILKTPSKEYIIGISENAVYLNISDYVKEDGTYEIISKVKNEDGTYKNVSEFFRFYNHDTVQLTFDSEGKAVFKNSDGSIADDVEYIYVNVIGYGGKFGNDNSEGAMVIAKGNCYPDLALDTSRIVDVRAAIVSDPEANSWGKYSCATSPDVVSEYKGVNGDDATVFQTLPVGKNLLNRASNTVGKKITATGDLTTNANYETTDFISVIGGEKYYFNTSINAFAYYDANKNVIGYKDYPSRPMIYDENVKYVRFSFAKSSTDVQFEQSAKATEYEEFIGAEMLDGNKVNFVDKSIKPEKTSFFELKASGKNLLNREAASVGYTLTSTGTLTTNAKNSTSDFIPVAYGDSICVSGVSTESGYGNVLFGYALYDENKSCISALMDYSLANKNNPVSIPRNARYIRCVYRESGTNIQIERGTVATEYEAFNGVPCVGDDYINLKMPNDLEYAFNPWCGKRLVVDGDSITHDQGRYDYWQFVAAKQHEMYLDKSNTDAYANGWKGVGGSRIANELGQNDANQSLVLRYMNLPDDADLVMIAGGTNDWSHNNVDLGDFDSTDNTTFNGALNELLPALKTKYPLVPVVMMTPIKRGTVHNKQNTKGNTLEQFVDAMIAKCRQYGVYCLDMYSNCPINPQIPVMKQLLFNENDDTHPNAEGHKVMGRTVAGFIRTLN